MDAPVPPSVGVRGSGRQTKAIADAVERGCVRVLLGALQGQGLLTDDEFGAARARLLG